VAQPFFAHHRRGVALVLAAGAVAPLAFAPFGLFPLIELSLTILFASWHYAQPRWAFIQGYLFGVGMFGVGVSWVFVSMHDFGGVPVSLGVFLTALFVLFLALFPAVVGASYARWFRRDASVLPLVVALPALWTSAEWCRGWIFTGFPWLAAGYSQSDSPLMGSAPLVGVYGVSWLAALVAAMLVVALVKKDRIKIVVPALILIFVVSAGLKNLEWGEAAGAPIEVALLQGNVSQDVKWRPEQREPTIDMYVAMTRANLDADLIIWPETALPAFQHQALPLLEGLRREAAVTGADLLIGMPVMNTQTRRYYNSMVRVGAPEQRYSKQHLVPFGEYIPFSGVLGRLMEIMQVPLPDFSIEPSRPVIELAGHPIGVSICYEDAFGEEVIDALPEATVLINASNDAWFGNSFAPHQHMQMARVRAIETQRPMLRATNTGITAVIDHRGQVIARAPQFEATALRAEVQPRQGATLYVRLGNVPIVVVLLGLCVGGWIFARRR
jgi:apolipoprotein N-acyltransferase